MAGKKLHESPRALSELARERIRNTACLQPHELLYYWANGISVAGLTPDPAQQIYCAVAAANYYAPKLSNIEIKQDVRVKAVISAAPMNQQQWAKKYLNQQPSTVSPPLPDVVPTVAYEVTPSDSSLVQQNINSGELIAETNKVIPHAGGEHDRDGDTQPSESSESSESLDPPSKS